MRVNTAELKNNLSRYLRQIRQTGETITVCERNRAVARLKPLRCTTQPRAQPSLQALFRKARRLGVTLRVPASQRPMREVVLDPEVAPDRRTDVATIDWLRGGRGY